MKIAKVSQRPLDARPGNMSLSKSLYEKGLKKLRKQAKKEKRNLITNDGIEIYDT